MSDKNSLFATPGFDFDETPVAEVPRKLRVGITQGDTNGVGYELIYKTFTESDIFEICTPIVYGHIKAAAYHKKALESNISVHIINTADEATEERLNLVSLSTEDVNVNFGKLDPEAGRAAFTALERAVDDLKSGLIDVLVTAPICKGAIHSEQFPFAGHTEYLHNRLCPDAPDPLMLMTSDLMRVAVVTTHAPLSEVPYLVTKERIEQRVQALYATLRRDFTISAPRIAVLSLNPHCGDNGMLGQEEIETIIPTVKGLFEAGIPCFGPYPADGFFGAAQFRQFDGVLAMYHDQGLTAFKAITGGEGVNFTAGLPFVRTSPDHGTAFDIAGQGIADEAPFRAAIYAAIDIYRHRERYNEASSAPLPKLYREMRENAIRVPRDAREPRENN